MIDHDPWDETPSAFEDDPPGPETWDPDELLARALHRARHQGGSHLLGDWSGIYHGIRAGNARLRLDAERAVLAERVALLAAGAVRLVREGDAKGACERLHAALAAAGGGR